jgi:hypothetical protein
MHFSKKVYHTGEKSERNARELRCLYVRYLVNDGGVSHGRRRRLGGDCATRLHAPDLCLGLFQLLVAQPPRLKQPPQLCTTRPRGNMMILV